MNYRCLSDWEEKIAKQIVDCAYRVHVGLGPGLLENVYETCFCHELKKHQLNFQRQVAVPVIYEGIRFEAALRLDVIVENSVICELNAVDQILPLFEAQILSYLRLSGKRLGFLINFHAPVIRGGIKRFIL
jgi:GxxExxY protein